MAVIHSTDLGWTEGQDVSSLLKAEVEGLSSGDILVLDHFYSYSSSDTIFMVEGTTLAGGVAGAGVDLPDTATNGATFLQLNDNVTIIDFTLTHSNAPNTGYGGTSPVQGTDYHGKFTINGDRTTGVTVINSHFKDNVSGFFNIANGSNYTFTDCEFEKGHYQIRLLLTTTDFAYNNCLFQDALGDGIKTAQGGSADFIARINFTGCVFMNNNRDGIDTTGGLLDSTIDLSYFIKMFTGCDFKQFYEDAEDFDKGYPVNENILVTNSEFIDCYTGGIVVTTIDYTGTINSGNATTWVAQNINANDCTFEHLGDTYKNCFQVKDSYNIHWDNMLRLGNLNVLKSVSNYDWGMPQDVNGNDTTGPARPYAGDPYYRSLAGTDPSNITYPAADSGLVYDGTLTIAFNG